MELDELKANWELLNEQLRKSEVLNRKVAKELIEKRISTARDRLVRANLLAIGLLLFFLVVIPLAAMHVSIRQEVLWITYTVLPATVLYSLWSIRFLYKFDLQTSTLVDLRKWVIAYKRRIRGELYCTPFIALGLFVSVFIIHHHYRSVQLMIFDGIMLLVGALATYLGYMYWDKRSVAEIESGLMELQDFESGE